MNKYGKTSVKIEYLLKGKLKCGYCGLSMNAENGTARNGERKYYYKCWGRKHGTKCHKEAIQKDLLKEMMGVISKVDYAYNSEEGLKFSLYRLNSYEESYMYEYFLTTLILITYYRKLFLSKTFNLWVK